MKTMLAAIRQAALAGAALLLLAAAPGRAHAAFIYTLTETGGNVVMTGSGTINTAGLNLLNNGTNSATIAPAIGLLYGGPVGSSNYTAYGTLSGPANFGFGTVTAPSAGTGSFVGFYGPGGVLNLPSGYVSGTALANTDTWTGATFTSLGFTPGTYVYSWGSGVNADSLTVTSVVPEPSTWALVGVGAGVLGVAIRRRKARHA